MRFLHNVAQAVQIGETKNTKIFQAALFPRKQPPTGISSQNTLSQLGRTTDVQLFTNEEDCQGHGGKILQKRNFSDIQFAVA